ncbi:MAG: PspC domain-containing protein [Bacteroidales bacterium]|nr:PspC domain-containing protein [Bacteroidales bacterium]
MKKTIKIKIGGVVFHIDEDAYVILSAYLDSLTDHFKGMDGGKEVMEDIEARIGEIFEQITSGHKEVIEVEDVEEMINILGQAKDIIEEDEEVTYTRQTTYSNKAKRLYRDPDNAVLGGVCGGLGAYFNVDPIWFRILFLILLLAYGTGLIYIVLWIVLPKAETPRQKLEMRGENVTVKNIEKSIKVEYENVKGNLSKLKDSDTYTRSTSAVNEVFRGIGNVILIFLKIILIIIGVVLIITGFSALLSFLGVLAFSNTLFFPDVLDIPSFHLPDILPIFTDPRSVPFVLIALILAVVIPLFALIYGGIKLIFRFKAKDGIVGLTAFIVWFIAVIGLASMVAFEGVNYSDSAKITNTVTLDSLHSNTLYLKTSNMSINEEDGDFIYFEVDNDGVYRDRNSGSIYGKPRFTIESSESGEVELEVQKRSHGRTSKIAWNHARELEYYWNQRDSLLHLDPYFKLAEGQRWRDPYVRLKLKVPEGTSIYLDENMTEIIYNIPNITGTWDFDMVNKTWTMTEEGLAEQDYFVKSDKYSIDSLEQKTDTLNVGN